MKEIYGIDVSHENGPVEWAKVKRSGKAGLAILRIHQRFGTDKQFERNYKGCTKRGIPLGAYKYSYALTAAEARQEAKEVIKLAKGKSFDYPIFYDLEWEELEKLPRQKIEEIALAFLEKVESAGLRVGIYCNWNWYQNYITDVLKTKYDFWIASYPSDDHGQLEERLRPPVGIGWQYSKCGKVDGITGNNGNVDMDVFYFPDDAKEPGDILEPESNAVTAEDILTTARGWLGSSEADGGHRAIVDLYNSHEPLAQGYMVSYIDSWCAVFVSACYIKAGATALIGGTECGVERFIEIFKKAGIWEEDGTITPQPGDIICYNWDDGTQPNGGFADHIGIVETVTGDYLTAIEGNYNDRVGRRTIPIGWGYIRGYARPKYGKSKANAQPAVKKTVDDLAMEVINGKWGNGADRISALRAAGYDPTAVQARVNEILA